MMDNDGSYFFSTNEKQGWLGIGLRRVSVECIRQSAGRAGMMQREMVCRTKRQDYQFGQRWKLVRNC